MILPDGYSDVPAGKIAAIVTHLEMTSHPAVRSDPASADFHRHSDIGVAAVLAGVVASSAKDCSDMRFKSAWCSSDKNFGASGSAGAIQDPHSVQFYQLRCARSSRLKAL